MFTIHERIGFRTTFLILLFLFIVSASTVFAQNKEMPITATKDAMALYVAARDKSENLGDPGTLYDQAIEKDPNFAMAYLFAGNLAKAVALVDMVTPGEKEWILAAKAQSDGDLDGRKMHLDQLLKLYPGDKRVQSQMGFYYRGQGDDPTSLKYFQESVKLDKKFAAAYNNIGYAYLRMENYPKAEAAFKTYIKLIPNNPNPYDSYGEMLMKAGKFDKSIVQYRRALAIDPKFYSAYRGIGKNYVYKGEYSKARETYKMMYDESTDDNLRSNALYSEMNSYLDEGKTDEALAINARRLALAQKTQDGGNLGGFHAFNGFILLESGRPDDAEKEYAIAANLRNEGPLTPAALQNRDFFDMLNDARTLIAQNKFDEAKVKVEAAGNDLEARPQQNRERTYNSVVGFLELGQNNYVKAAESFANANPNDPYIWYYRAVALEGAGDKKAASSLYLKVVNWNSLENPGHSMVRSRAKAKLAAMLK